MTTKVLNIKENGKEMKVFIPDADKMDKSQLHDIIQTQTEKTREQLRAKPNIKKTPEEKKKTAEKLKDYAEFRRRKQRGEKKYY